MSRYGVREFYFTNRRILGPVVESVDWLGGKKAYRKIVTIRETEKEIWDRINAILKTSEAVMVSAEGLWCVDTREPISNYDRPTVRDSPVVDGYRIYYRVPERTPVLAHDTPAATAAENKK